MDSMFHGDVDPLFSRYLGSNVPGQNEANGTCVAGKQVVESPMNMGNEMA